MAVTSATSLSGFSGFINRDQAAPIFDRAAKVSVVQRLAKQVPLSYRGSSIPVTTGRPTAGWVGEAGQKPASTGTMSLKNIDPKKLAVLIPVSKEVVRANPGGFMQNIRRDVAEAFAIAFDLAAIADRGPTGGAGGGPFATYLAQTTKSVELGTADADAGGVHADLVAAMSLLVNDGKRLTGWGLDDRMEPTLLGAVDTVGRPLYVDLATGDTTVQGEARLGRLLNRPSAMNEGIYTTDDDIVAVAGDWTQAAWGTVGGIEWAISEEATVTINGELVSAFENNLYVVRAEAEYGWVVADPESFVLVKNATS